MLRENGYDVLVADDNATVLEMAYLCGAENYVALASGCAQRREVPSGQAPHNSSFYFLDAERHCGTELSNFPMADDPQGTESPFRMRHPWRVRAFGGIPISGMAQ